MEITGPTSRKMVINALNSGARGFMADFEDANSPTWSNMVGGQVNLTDAVRGAIEHEENGKQYELGDEPATLLVRPRGWHLPERHLTVDGEPVAGALVDFALYVYHNAHELLERGTGPYFYLPKLESHLEARLWNDAFRIAEDALGLDRGTIRATVLIETLPAAFEMDEILYELREHSAGLNAGRWDYIFSAIKRFRTRPEFVLPDRSQVTMTVPFMRAYTELLVKTCHRRGAHAMGGMSAVIPSRTDEEANRARVRGRARRQGARGRRRLRRHLGRPPRLGAGGHGGVRRGARRPPQPGRPPARRRGRGRRRPAGDRHDRARSPRRACASNVNVGIQYISSWLRGNGAAAIYGLMEDAATAEISRAQVWQWIRHGATLDDGRTVTPELVRELETEELEKIRAGDRRRRVVRARGPPARSRASSSSGGAERRRSWSS